MLDAVQAIASGLLQFAGWLLALSLCVVLLGAIAQNLQRRKADKAAFGGDVDAVRKFRAENVKIALRRAQESQKS
jgi:hypothetical protein